MFHLKHDVKIQIKNEKEVFRFVRLLIFTFIFSAVFLGVPDYIRFPRSWYTVPPPVMRRITGIPSCRRRST